MNVHKLYMYIYVKPKETTCHPFETETTQNFLLAIVTAKAIKRLCIETFTVAKRRAITEDTLTATSLREEKNNNINNIKTKATFS